MSCFANRAFAGAAGGLVATVPMSAVMLIGHRWLPWRQRDPLPPQQITNEALASVDLHDDLDSHERAALAVFNHFAYGAGMGLLYGGLTAAAPSTNRVSSGIAYGLAVWTASYLGLVPALGLYRSAVQEPAGRNALMIAAHVVWGASLGVMTELAATNRHQTCTIGQRGSITMENANAHQNKKKYTT
jgi:uncharacterized membrane protein YagU involved in acid resistance